MKNIQMNQSHRCYIENMTDREIVYAILNRDALVTRLFFYEKCYPLFKTRFDKYYTDCTSCLEFINDMYCYIMEPGGRTGKCYLSTFKFSCTFICWLKIVTENYCRQLFKKKSDCIENVEYPSDRNMDDSISPNIECFVQYDVGILLNLMPNARYRDLIRYRYVEEKSNEETAELLGMSMSNYYNKHKLAKEQFISVLKKEGMI